MQRCLQLATLGKGSVAPNPLVGAVLAHEGRIIGEGYHQQFGKAHAEVNCVNSVKAEDRELIRQSTLYVSLEPCAHFGKTPPCADLIISEGIPEVVVGCRDPFPAVNGKGIEKLEQAGIRVVTGVMEEECLEINKRFFYFHQQHRPWVVLKWAQTANGWIAHEDRSRMKISGDQANRLVHQWRSEEMAILVGTNTAFYDDPALTVRHWPGVHPIRLVADLAGRLPAHLQLFDSQSPTLVFNADQHTVNDQWIKEKRGVAWYQVKKEQNLVPQILEALYHLQITSVLVEGGRQLLQSFIDEKSWNEARVITNTSMRPEKGFPAPVLHHYVDAGNTLYGDDEITVFHPHF